MDSLVNFVDNTESLETAYELLEFLWYHHEVIFAKRTKLEENGMLLVCCV